MKTKAQQEADQRVGEKKRLTILMACAAALLVIGIAVVLILTGSGRATVKGTLEEYFGTMYTTNGKGFDEMAACFAPDLQTEWYNTMTLQGLNFSQLVNWRLEATEQVGDHTALKVRVTETAGGTAADLAVLQQTYAGAQAVRDVIFKLDITGDTGSLTAHGAAELVKLEGKWYFVSASIPVTVESRAGSAQEWFDKYGSTEGASD